MLFKKKRNYDTESEFLESVCSDASGAFVPDDDEKAVSCVFSDSGVAVTYFSDKDVYVITFGSDSYSVTIVSKDRPDLAVVSSDGKAYVKFEVKKPSSVIGTPV